MKPVWSNIDNEPLVSICCITYNHKRYIRDAIEGFLMQETTFPFEIIINDDASTDGTTEIIRSYEDKYPGLIRPIYHKENEYSQGIRAICARNTFPKANGKYIALCEGDDYWTDPLKLQKQVDFMEANEDCSSCFHPVRIVFENQIKEDMIVGPRIKGDHIFHSNEIVEGIFIRLVSMVIRSDIVRNIPDWFLSAPYGDLPLQLICADRGNVGYIGGEAMSIYRRGLPGAWSELENGDKEERKKWKERRLKDHLMIFDMFNKYSAFRFNKEIKLRKKRQMIGYLSSCFQFYNKSDQRKLIRNNFSILMNFRSKNVIAIWVKFIIGESAYNVLRKRVKKV